MKVEADTGIIMKFRASKFLPSWKIGLGIEVEILYWEC